MSQKCDFATRGLGASEGTGRASQESRVYLLRPISPKVAQAPSNIAPSKGAPATPAHSGAFSAFTAYAENATPRPRRSACGEDGWRTNPATKTCTFVAEICLSSSISFGGFGFLLLSLFEWYGPHQHNTSLHPVVPPLMPRRGRPRPHMPRHLFVLSFLAPCGARDGRSTVG